MTINKCEKCINFYRGIFDEPCCMAWYWRKIPVDKNCNYFREREE